MKIRKHRLTAASLLAVLSLLVLCGCKPTEKHYRAAYDRARQKREAEENARRELERDLQIVGSVVIQEVDGVRLEPLGGDTVWVLHKLLTKDGGVAPYSLAIARMKMRANALGMAESDAGRTVAKGGEEYFVLAAESESVEEILEKKRAFEKKNKDFHTPGLPGVTIVIR